MNRNVAIAAVALVVIVAVAAAFVFIDGDDKDRESAESNALKDGFLPGDFISYNGDKGVIENVVVTEVYDDGTYQVFDSLVSDDFRYTGGLRMSQTEIVSYVDIDNSTKLGEETLKTVFGEIECTKYEVVKVIGEGEDRVEYKTTVWNWNDNGIAVKMVGENNVTTIAETSFLKGQPTPAIDPSVPVPEVVGTIPDGLKVDSVKEIEVGDYVETHTVTVEDGVSTEKDSRTEVVEIDGKKVKVRDDTGMETWIKDDLFLTYIYIDPEKNPYAKTVTAVMDTFMGERAVTKYTGSDWFQGQDADGTTFEIDDVCNVYVGEDGVLYKTVNTTDGVETTVTVTSTSLLATN